MEDLDHACPWCNQIIADTLDDHPKPYEAGVVSKPDFPGRLCLKVMRDNPNFFDGKEHPVKAHSESDTYVVEITLATDNGELPTQDEVERLVADQMGVGDMLDEGTGLACIGVRLTSRHSEAQ